MQTVEGYILSLALDENDEVIGYKFINSGVMIEKIKKGMDPKEAFESSTGIYSRFAEGVKYIDPRNE